MRVINIREPPPILTAFTVSHCLKGETELRFSYLGYATETRKFTLSKDTLLNIRMQGNTQLEEVIIISDKAEAGAIATQMGAVEIPMAQIKNTPSILGEADVMKTIQLMPGVQAGVDGSAGLYIRGGSPDQNLILLDGTPVYNVDHLFGFFSVFTPEAVKKVTLFKKFLSRSLRRTTFLRYRCTYQRWRYAEIPRYVQYRTANQQD